MVRTKYLYAMRVLVNIIVVFPLIFSCSPGNKEESIIQEVNSFYKENKDISFKIFNNWNIGIREGEKGLYIMDFIENRETVKDRFIIKKNDDSLYIKRIFPKQDTIFHLLNKQELVFSDYPFSELYFRDLILQFFSLKASKIRDIEDGLFLIEKDGFSILYSESQIGDIQNMNKYGDYTKFNEYVWYYIPK